MRHVSCSIVLYRQAHDFTLCIYNVFGKIEKSKHFVVTTINLNRIKYLYIHIDICLKQFSMPMVLYIIHFSVNEMSNYSYKITIP